MPTVFDSGSADIVADQNNDIQVNIWDTSGWLKTSSSSLANISFFNSHQYKVTAKAKAWKLS